MTHRQASRRKRGARRAVAGVAVLAVLAAAVAIGFSIWGGGPSGYRMAAASTASVEKTLLLSGTFAPVQQAAASFQVAGSVASVSATVGEQVSAGQTLASLTSTTLQANLTAAQSNLSAAQAKLNQDESGQATTTSFATGTTGPVADAVLLADTGSTALPSLSQAQDAVVAAQKSADADLETAAADLTSAETACAGSTPTATASGPVTGTDSSRSSVTGTSSSGPDATACADALTQAEAAQNQVSADQQTLASAESTLSQVLASMANASLSQGGGTSPSPSTSDGSGSGSGSGGSGSGSGGGSGRGQSSPSPSPSPARSGSGKGTAGAGGSGSSSGTGTSPSTTSRGGSGSPAASTEPSNSAQQLASDQAAIDTAEASVVEAQQSLDDADLTAPIAGMVASVNVTAGQTVQAGSTSETIVIVNSGSFQTTSSLTSSQVAEVAVGDTAQVTVDGASGPVSGTVSRVGPVNATSSSVTYPLVVALNASPPGAADGATARISVDVAQASNALVVPTSAVHTTAANRSYVIEVSAGQETEKSVVVGVVGSLYTQIMSGITKGAQVVLADYSQSVPSSSSSTGRTFGGAGGLGGGTFRVGGGGAGGGFTGGGFTGGGGGGGGGARQVITSG